MNLQALDDLRRNGDFVTRVAVASAKAAVAVLNEAANVPQHEYRLAWARRTLGDPAGYAAEFLIWPVVATTTIAARADYAAVTDADIETAISAVLTGLVTPVTVQPPTVPR